MIVDLSKLRPGETVRLAAGTLVAAVALTDAVGNTVVGPSVEAAQALLDEARSEYDRYRKETA